MDSPMRKDHTRLLVTVILLLAGACLLLAFAGSWQSATDNVALGGVNGETKVITAIHLKAAVTPSRVVEGQEVKVSGSITIRGGPGPIDFAARIPKGDGGFTEGRITTMIDHDAVYGFEYPVRVGLKPGTRTFVFKASAGGVSDTKSVTLTVSRAPGMR